VGKLTSPVLCFVTKETLDHPLQARKTILQKFPKSQHRPVVLDVGINLLKINKPELPRWNIHKADWEKFKQFIEENINRIDPIPENYRRFTKLIKSAAVKNIPR